MQLPPITIQRHRRDITEPSTARGALRALKGQVLGKQRKDHSLLPQARAQRQRSAQEVSTSGNTSHSERIHNPDEVTSCPIASADSLMLNCPSSCNNFAPLSGVLFPMTRASLMRSNTN